MAVYVDAIQEYPVDLISPAAQRFGTRWCHMTADTPRELLDMARKLKLSPAYLQRGGSRKILHFDLVPSKRAQAIRFGAVEITGAEMIAKWDENNIG